jgi:hypothetical protein
LTWVAPLLLTDNVCSTVTVLRLSSEALRSRPPPGPASAAIVPWFTNTPLFTVSVVGAAALLLVKLNRPDVGEPVGHRQRRGERSPHRIQPQRRRSDRAPIDDGADREAAADTHDVATRQVDDGGVVGAPALDWVFSSQRRSNRHQPRCSRGCRRLSCGGPKPVPCLRPARGSSFGCEYAKRSVRCS